MNWKAFITAFVSAVLIFSPHYGSSCVDTEDPHDYFTSFFSRNVSNDKVYEPFYYTALLPMYDDSEWEKDTTYDHDLVIKEWQEYCHNTKADDVVTLVYKSSLTDLKAASENSNLNKPVPAKLRSNSMLQYLLKENKKPVIDYLIFAKTTETFCVQQDWEDKKPADSLTLNKYLSRATDLWNKATDPFLKTKYAYQQCKLAFYNHRYKDCIRYYDAYFTPEQTAAVRSLALSYKAGSLFRIGRNKEAAYLFSKAFVLDDQNKKSNFLGFLWSSDSCKESLENDYATLCKSDKEKAVLFGMFGLYGTGYRLETLNKVYSLDPSSPLLPVLATRETNKLEEQYFTPQLEKENNSKALYIRPENEGKDLTKDKQQLAKTLQLFEKIGADKNVANRVFYLIDAAYLSFINKDFSKARKLLKDAKKETLTGEMNDQAQMINLLIVANENKSLDKETEKQLISSMEWLTSKVKDNNEYRVFFRNFFAQILAPRYEKQGEAYKAAMAYGVANMSFLNTHGEGVFYYPVSGIEYLRSELGSDQLLKLYELMNSKARTGFEDYLVSHTSFKRDDVVDVIGTSYLRDRNYMQAIDWLKKADKPAVLTVTNYNYETNKETTVNVDPFYDYLNDWQRYTKSVAKPYTKLSLVQKLVELQSKIDTAQNAESKSRMCYLMASALYNMSYYGNSWQAIAYYRSGSDWNEGNYKTEWQKEYYGVYQAKNYYQKAYDLTKEKEFKAACFFMMAKCAQRQIPRPEFNYNNYQEAEKKDSIFYVKFKNNPMFPAFKAGFGDTKFYKYVYNRCSYLRDFAPNP